ncbi:MAG TPA: hypothetical protein VFE96_05915 [Candidatus Bathyarchaeia archaeon]|jgi:hypothetical protein|nr:hypothetical protein [Candidatus Bathyarchaeia archaeon]
MITGSILRENEEVLWNGSPRVSRRLLGVFFLGLFSTGCVVYFALMRDLLAAMGFGMMAEFTLPIFVASCFPSRNCLYQITDSRLFITRDGVVRRSVDLDEIDVITVNDIRVLGFAFLTIGSEPRSKWRSPNWFTLGLLRKTEAEEAKQVVLEVRYAKAKGLI